MGQHRPDVRSPSGAATRSGLGSRLWLLPPLVTLVLVAPAFLREELSVYDGGLFLTLSRFLGPEHLLYRDLWTLYGPGPPVLGSIVMQLFGPGVAPIRIASFLVNVSIVVAVLLIARRFVPAWLAGILATVVAAIGYPMHFQQTLALVLWGLWFALRAPEDPQRSSRRLLVAALLFGLTFWGRFEFVIVGVALVLGLWLAARDSVDRSARRRILWVGLAPPILFLLYLVLVVGPPRAWLNLVDYPFLRYADQACRGLPPAWSQAARALTAPLRGHPWSMTALVLWTSTFVAPMLGALCLVVGWRKRQERLVAFLPLASGALTLFLWLEHRPRASLSPNPVVPIMVVSAAIVIGALAVRRRIAARATSVAVTAAIVLTLAVSTDPAALRAWTGWPPYDRLLGWEGGRVEGLYDVEVWSGVAAEVQARSAPGEEIFVALTDNSSRHHANAPIFYWYANRPPASRFLEFDPCLTDTPEVQREIVADLSEVNVVVTTTFFPDTRSQGPRLLDEVLASEFSTVYRGDLPGEQAVFVLERSSDRV